jgi:hypothetical protein
MTKQELREKILIDLLLSKHKDEEVNAQLVRTIEDEFNVFIKELGLLNKPHAINIDRLRRNAY